MLGKGVNRLPVVDDGTLVGIVTRADLVRAFVRTDEAIRAEIVDAIKGLDAAAVQRLASAFSKQSAAG